VNSPADGIGTVLFLSWNYGRESRLMLLSRESNNKDKDRPYSAHTSLVEVSQGAAFKLITFTRMAWTGPELSAFHSGALVGKVGLEAC